MGLIEYHKSTSDELIAITNKVRNLVRRWGEDGRYKEVVLKNVINKFLPKKYSIGTGFVVNQTDSYGEHLASKQIDLIVFDNDSPILFREGDFIILTADSVRAIIEVKANIQNQNLEDIVRQANENGKFIFSGKKKSSLPFFNGVFGYEGYNSMNNFDTISQYVQNANSSFETEQKFNKFKVNHIALNKDLFLKYWPERTRPHCLYRIEDLSFSFFISNLVNTLAEKSVIRNNFIWYATDKELNMIREF